MATFSFQECDVCGSERDSRKDDYWANIYGPMYCSAKGVPSLQGDMTISCVCPLCAKRIWAAWVYAVKALQKEDKEAKL